MNPAQQEQLLNIGAYLKNIREETGKTVDEVANQIFIRPALVRAIESGDAESLPEPVFVQGFIRRYADCLGLNGLEVAKDFEPTPVAVLPNPELANSNEVEGVVSQQDRHGLKVLSKAEPVPSRVSPAAPANGNGGWGWLVGLAGLAAFIGLISWLTLRNTPQQADSGTTEAPAETAVAPASEVEAPEEEAAAPPPATAAPSDAPITFAVNLEGDSWMRVIVDGEEVYEGILTAGTQESWTAESEMTITAGNSGEVLYSFNGSDETPLGAPGAVSNLTLTPETDPETLAAQ